ncbi:MAG: SBBP repeat-containing protein [Ignavibacteria bacterium]|nr:SBBP repeat-containing protein [Ignavibacteria bacterium]
MMKLNSLVVDGSGNVYVTGYSYGNGTSNDYATIKIQFRRFGTVGCKIQRTRKLE